MVTVDNLANARVDFLILQSNIVRHRHYNRTRQTPEFKEELVYLAKYMSVNTSDNTTIEFNRLHDVKTISKIAISVGLDFMTMRMDDIEFTLDDL